MTELELAILFLLMTGQAVQTFWDLRILELVKKIQDTLDKDG